MRRSASSRSTSTACPTFLLAAILGYEGGIGVRSGCFCAHPYVVHLLALDDHESRTWRDKLLGGDKSEMPGMVRASFGCYNNFDDVDRLVAYVAACGRRGLRGATTVWTAHRANTHRLTMPSHCLTSSC